VLAELHKHDEWRRIPVVVITGMDLSQADRARLKQQTRRFSRKEPGFNRNCSGKCGLASDHYRAP